MMQLSDHLKSRETSPNLARLILAITNCCSDIADLLRHGPMNDILGLAGAENVQGEDQKKLDVISNDMLKDALSATGLVRGLASEEEENCVACSGDGEFLSMLLVLVSFVWHDDVVLLVPYLLQSLDVGAIS